MHLMGRNCVSSDESDDSSDKFAESDVNVDKCRHVVAPVWRSPELTTFIRGLDVEVEKRKQPVLGQKRKARSRRVFRKVDSPERLNENAKAPHGLPKNCYDEGWYNNLHPFRQRQLQRRETEYIFDGGVEVHMALEDDL